MASGSSQPGSAPPSLPQSPSARRGVNLLDEVVSVLFSVQRDNLSMKSVNNMDMFFAVKCSRSFYFDLWQYNNTCF